MASRESLFSTHSILGTGRFWIDSEQKILKYFAFQAPLEIQVTIE